MIFAYKRLFLTFHPVATTFRQMQIIIFAYKQKSTAQNVAVC